MDVTPTAHDLAGALRSDGFAFVRGDEVRARVAAVGSLTDWDTFRDSWDALEPDPYLAEIGRRRRRRHAVFRIEADGTTRLEPNQPHYQTVEHNTLQGGIPRWFAPIEPRIATGATLGTLLRFAWQTFSPLASGPRRWRAELHQMRIEASADQAGEPTPEGVHRDGVDYVLVLLVARRNIVSGTTTIFTPRGLSLGSFTLTVPFDSAFVDDARVWHGVTAVEPFDRSAAASRDVLVLTLKGITESE